MARNGIQEHLNRIVSALRPPNESIFFNRTDQLIQSLLAAVQLTQFSINLLLPGSERGGGIHIQQISFVLVLMIVLKTYFEGKIILF